MSEPQRRPRALVIAHDPTGGAAMIGTRLTERGFDVIEHVVCDHPDHPHEFRRFPDDVDDHDLLVVMGAVWSVYDHAAIGGWIDDELAMLRRWLAADRPVLGICFGGQALAAALGGSVEPAVHTEIGWSEFEPVGDPATSRPDTGPWFQWHHDQFRVPAGVELLARNSAGEQLFRVGRCVGTQFHPEVDPKHIDGFLSFAPDDYLAEHGVEREALRASVTREHPRAQAICAEFVDWYLDDVARFNGR